MIKEYRSLLGILAAGVIIGFLHGLLAPYIISADVLMTFTYPIPVLYVVFAFISLVIVGVLLFLQKKYKEQIGYVFLFLTTFKMGLGYLLMLPVLNQDLIDVKVEKINFFIIFIVFLLIEVIYTMQILNNSEK